MGVLYPGSLIAVVSGTAEQATLIVKKIQDYFIRNPEIMREIQADSHRAEQLSRNKGICTLKNGSKIEMSGELDTPQAAFPPDDIDRIIADFRHTVAAVGLEQVTV